MLLLAHFNWMNYLIKITYTLNTAYALLVRHMIWLTAEPKRQQHTNIYNIYNIYMYKTLITVVKVEQIPYTTKPHYY